MTSSQWLDLAILAVAFVAAVSGWRSGALGSLLSFIGVVLGAVAGVLLAPHVVANIDGPRTKLFVTLFLILALVVVGEIAGVVLGRAVRGALRNPGLRVVDSIIGSGLQLLTVLIAAWLLASPLTTQPALAGAVRGSKVLTEVNALAPEWLQKVPTRLAGLLDTSGLPAVLEPFSRTPVVAVDAPDAALATSPVIEATRASVVKIRGTAPSCQKVLEGSGFVIAPNRVMSNAHVVAGAETVTVEVPGQPEPLPATVVSYDPNQDISILAVPDLPSVPLIFDDAEAQPTTDAIVMGYPGGGDFTATPARVRETIELNGPDIYNSTVVTRTVYTIRGSVKQGNSGGPMVDKDGKVLGVVFGAAVDDADTGFVLTAKQVEPQRQQVGNTNPVPTGVCIGQPG